MQDTNGFLGIVYSGTAERFYVDQKGGGFRITSAASFPINNWYHVAIVYNAGVIVLYVNGVSQGQTASFDALTASATVTNIGCYVAGNEAFKGNISNLRVTKDVAVYTGSFTVPTQPLTTTQSSGTNIEAIVAGECQLLLNTATPPDYFADASTNGFIVTNVNGVTTSITSPF
jgi:hypothetical protein